MSNVSFERWLDRAEALCVRRTGLDLDSLGDGPSWDSWNDGGSPAEYVLDRMMDAGFPLTAARPATPNTGRRPEPARPGMYDRSVPSNGTLNMALAQRKVLGHLPKLY